MYIDEIARVCHEANRAVQQLHDDPRIPVNPPWDELDEDLRGSTIAGVEAAVAGCTPEQLHAAWCDERLAAGWVWGPVKDPEQKTHPSLVAYEDLDEGQRDKDRLFHAIVGALAPQPTEEPDHDVLVTGLWDGGRRVLLDGAELKLVRSVNVLQDVESRPYSEVTVTFHTTRAVVERSQVAA